MARTRKAAAGAAAIVETAPLGEPGVATAGVEGDGSEGGAVTALIDRRGVVADIPLNRLKKSPRNARKQPHSLEAIQALAGSIAAKAMLHPPTVEPELDAAGEPSGDYLVTIGEGRRLAMALLAQRGTVARDEPVRCIVSTAHDPFEISLDENVTRDDNQIEKAYGPNNAILDNCHVRVAFATNDERTAKRVSDALGTATELRAMKNYAGHRLSPWLGHLMVSRQETARPLLTPGEVMQLPPSDELVLLSGCAPIRARKVRYFEDPALRRRVGAPPKLEPAPPRKGAQSATAGAVWLERATPELGGEGGLRLEPDLEAPDAPELSVPATPEFADFDDYADGVAVEALAEERDAFRLRSGLAARQASLDPNDGIDL